MRTIKNILFPLIFIGFTVLVSSCLSDEIDELEGEANTKLQEYLDANGYTEADHIGYGVYVKITQDTVNSSTYPTYGDAIVFNYTGKYTDGTVFESTDSNYVDDFDYGEYYIFGPTRRWVGTLISGFDTAIRTIPEGASAEIVIPSDMAFGDYNPVVYNVDLLKVVDNDSIYEKEVFNEFKNTNGFDDSVYISKGLLYKADTVLRTSGVLTASDSVTIKIIGRYAECYYSNGLGRQFYPLGDEDAKIEGYNYAGTNDDISLALQLDAVDSALKYMRVGETMEVAFLSGADGDYEWGFGSSSVVNTYLNIPVILAYTPLHYTITLLESSATEDDDSAE